MTAESTRRETDSLIRELNPTFVEGLSQGEAERRLKAFGRNVPFSGRRRNRLWEATAPLKEPMVWLLVVATLIYNFLGDKLDAAITGVAIIPIGLIDLLIEVRTDSALRKLEELGAPQSTVVRSGEVERINPEHLVVGDRMVISEGEVVMADAAIAESSGLQVDESSLSGESLPISKSFQPYYSEDVFGNRGTLFAGTKVLAGRGVCLVVRTGGKTQLGKIGSSLAGTRRPRTRLQKDISRIVWVFGATAVVLSVLLIPIALLRGDSLGEASLGAVSLAIAAIPEELPVAFTIFLAFGMLELSKNHALVKRLPAVEALGSINVICTDKTGTLTEGAMTVAEAATDARYEFDRFKAREEAGDFVLHALMACAKDPFDPMDRAIHDAARSTPAFREFERCRLVEEYPFDAKKRCASRVWETDGHFTVSSKGSVEAILALCNADERTVTAERLNEEMGAEGIRVLALAYKHADGAGGGREADESGLTLQGLIGFSDPIREGVQRAVKEARAAGIRVIMLTGDQKATAQAVAHRAGIDHEVVFDGRELDDMTRPEFLEAVTRCNVFCRVTPEHKLRIVEGLQQQGFNVSVTGDGVNDSPALKRADIGVAMGKRGTDVAKEAASLVLLDDNFKTIVGAIRNGRKIYDNLQNVFGYLVAFHVPIFFAALSIPILGLPLLLLPIQIVVLELVLHPVFSLVFEAQPASSEIMNRPPRAEGAPILDRRSLVRLFLIGMLIFFFSITGYVLGFDLGYDEARARSLAFTAMVVAQLAIVPSELGKQRLTLSELLQNRRFGWVLSAVVVTYLAVLYFPPAAAAAKMAPLSATDWGFVSVSGLATYLLAERTKRLKIMMARPMARHASQTHA